jgi:hypothetical protein
MTDLLLDYDPNDTGEVNRLPGETRIRIDLGEPTQRIDPRLISAPSFDAVPRKVYDLDDTVVYLPQTIGVVPDTERLSLLGSVAGVDGELRPAAPGPKPGPLPPTPPPAPKPGYAGRHRLTFSRRVRRLITGMGIVGAALFAIWLGLTMAALAVVL